MLDLILLNVRTPREREGDLEAQIGACRVGERRILEVAEKYGERRLTALVDELLDYSERLVRTQLRSMPGGEFSAEDWLDDDGVTEIPRKIAVRLRLDPVAGAIHVDFAGSSPQVAGSVNAVRAITLSACFYVLRCLLKEDAPATEGTLRPLALNTPPGSIVDALPPAAVAGGNVETSQRIVDVLLRALAQVIPARVPAASAGTMSNLTIGGVDPRTGEPFTYYETTAGGMGARPGMDGISGVQTHMTNSLNTPIEALEYAYPFRVRRYAYRDGSGGAGRFRGGDGLIREVEMLAPARLTLLADRRRFRPYGLEGGGEGAAGCAWIVKTGNSEAIALPGKCSLQPRCRGCRTHRNSRRRRLGQGLRAWDRETFFPVQLQIRRMRPSSYTRRRACLPAWTQSLPQHGPRWPRARRVCRRPNWSGGRRSIGRAAGRRLCGGRPQWDLRSLRRSRKLRLPRG